MTKIVAAFHEKVDYEPEALFLLHNNLTANGYPKHWHNAVEIIMPNKGSYKVDIHDKKYELSEYDILLIPSREFHTIHTPEAKGQRIIVQFALEALNTIRGFINASFVYAKPYLITPESEPELHEPIKALLLGMLDEYLNQHAFYEVAITNMMLDITLRLARKHQKESGNQYPSLAKRMVYSDKLNECFDYANRHYNERVTLETAAQAIGFSKFHFARWFQELTGMSFHEYLTRIRIDKAESLLLTTSLPITVIALESGFQCTATFNRIFKQKKNCTPSEFRKWVNYTNPDR